MRWLWRLIMASVLASMAKPHSAASRTPRIRRAGSSVKTEALTAVQEDVKILRDVRHWLNQVLPSEQYRQTAEPGKKPSIQQAVKGREQRIREEQAEKRRQPRRQQKRDMEL